MYNNMAIAGEGYITLYCIDILTLIENRSIMPEIEIRRDEDVHITIMSR